MTLRFLFPETTTSIKSEKDQCIFNIRKIAPLARALTAIDLADDVDNTFTILENLSCKTSFKDYHDAATKFLTNNFDYGSSLFIPKLVSDTRHFLASPAIVADLGISSAYYYATQNAFMSLITFGITVPLALCIGYCVFQDKLTAAYAQQYYNEETWKPISDLKKQLEYFNANFVTPENTDIEKLKLDNLIEISIKKDNRLTI